MIAYPVIGELRGDARHEVPDCCWQRTHSSANAAQVSRQLCANRTHPRVFHVPHHSLQTQQHSTTRGERHTHNDHRISSAMTFCLLHTFVLVSELKTLRGYILSIISVKPPSPSALGGTHVGMPAFLHPSPASPAVAMTAVNAHLRCAIFNRRSRQRVCCWLRVTSV